MIAWPAVSAKYVRFIGRGEGAAGWGESMSGSSVLALGWRAAGLRRRLGELFAAERLILQPVASVRRSAVQFRRPTRRGGEPPRGGQPCPVRRYPLGRGLARVCPARSAGPEIGPLPGLPGGFRRPTDPAGFYGAYVHYKQVVEPHGERVGAAEAPRMPAGAVSRGGNGKKYLCARAALLADLRALLGGWISRDSGRVR
jgi:hypothetical protein